MKDYLTEINDLFPIRRREEEKQKFYNYVKTELGEDRVKRETLCKKHNNIVIGDVEEASVVFTAHYDTPMSSLVPNLMFPADKLKGTLFHFAYPLLLAILSLLVALSVCSLLGLGENYAIVFYFVLYFGIFYCTTRLVINKHNKNDNTSGIATIMSLASEINNEKVAFILFDNEEKGLLGSKAYAKANNYQMKNKLVINFDCVGNGDQIIFIIKEMAEKHELYELLKAVTISNEHFDVHHLPFKKCLSNSDYKNFPCGIGVMASSRARIVKFYTGRIHTSRDTVADSENVYFISGLMKKFISEI